MKKSVSLITVMMVFIISVNTPYTSISSSAVDLDSIKESAAEAGNAAKDKLNNAGNAAKEKASEAGKAASQATDNVEKAAKDAAGTVKDKASDVGNTITEGTSKAIDSASSAASAAGSNIKNYISNIDTAKFKSGWDYASKYTGTAIAAINGQAYVNSVQSTITNISSNMQSELNSKVISNRTIQQDAGFAAEIWHTNTFNIDAALNGSDYNAVRPDSKAKASADITVNGTNYSQDYSLKYYKDASSSANAQAKTFYEDYRQYASKAQRNGNQVMTAEEYLAQYDKPLDSLYDSLYSGQEKLIPSDQLDDAKAYLNKKKNKMSTSESLERQKFSPELQESLDSLASRVEAPDGTSSKPLTEAEAKELVQLTRDGDLNLEDFRINPAQLITPKYILKQSINAGTQAAIISTAFAIGPDIYSIIVDAAKNGKVDESALKQAGIEGVLAGSEGFVEGSVSCAIVIACQSGKFGSAYTNIAPETVGTLTVLTIDAIRFGYQLSSGQITDTEYADLMAQNIIIAIASQTTGALLQALFPFLPFAYVAGSMAGAMVASAGYSAGKDIILEMRGENGFETVVPETLSSGKSLANNIMSNINITDTLSNFQQMAVSTIGNGKILVQKYK